MFYLWLIPLLIILAVLLLWAFSGRATIGSGKRQEGRVLKDDDQA